MKKTIILVFLLIAIMLGLGIWYFFGNKENTPEPTLITEVTYICNGEKTIKASYYKGENIAVEPGEQPIPSGSVGLVLSDGKTLNLKQTISADGGRYANEDESFVFWGKGNGALVLENNEEKSYIGCVVLSDDIGGLSKVYLDGTVGFSIRYPSEYTLNKEYKYTALGPNKDINGVKFTIPEAMATGTNLSSNDTGVSVEIIPNIQDCSANLFLDGETANIITDDNDNIEYSFASTIQEAAGSNYEEYIWALPGTNPCINIRYFIHSTSIVNYPDGSVKEFNRSELLKQFDSIRHSLVHI